MSQSYVIAGVVRDPQGEPLQDARVYVTKSPMSLPDIAVLTDRGGGFSLAVPSAGTYVLGCSADGFSPAQVTVVISGKQVPSVEIKLKP